EAGGLAADVYAFGALLTELLTLRPPFIGELAAIERGHLALRPPRPSRFAAEVPAAVDELVLACLAKDPRRRPAAAAALRRRLDRARAPRRARGAPRAPRRPPRLAHARIGPARRRRPRARAPRRMAPRRAVDRARAHRRRHRRGRPRRAGPDVRRPRAR